MKHLFKPRICFDADHDAFGCWQLPADGAIGSKHKRCEVVGWGKTPWLAYVDFCFYAGIEIPEMEKMTAIRANPSDLDKKIEAMYHLETCFEPCDEKGAPKSKAEIDAHITAAHYLIQSMFDGYKPDNYDEIMAEAAKYDAIDETNCLLHRLKGAK